MIVRCGNRESVKQVLAIGSADRRIVEPADLANRTKNRRDRPFAPSRIEERQSRGFVDRIVARRHVIMDVIPDVVAVGVRSRCGGCRTAPPRGGCHGDGIQLDRVSCRTFTATGDGERHGRISIDGGERKASFVEVRPAERLRAARFTRRSMLGQNRIARGLVAASAAVGDRFRDAFTEELGDARRRAGPQVEHATTSRMPRRITGHVDVDVILERHVRPDDVDDVDLRRGRGFGIRIAVFVGSERAFVRMRARVFVGNSPDGRVGEDDGAVVRRDVAAVQPLADEKCGVVRVVVVDGIQLVEMPAIASEHDWNAANVDRGVARHPERRVRAGDEKLGVGWAQCGTRSFGARDSGGAQRGGEEAAHRWQIYCVLLWPRVADAAKKRCL